MKKGVRVLAGLAFGLALLPASATGQRDSVVAVGHVLQTDFVAVGEAGPNGEDPVGSIRFSGFLNFTTATTCLNVSGNTVVGGGRILTGRNRGRGFLSSSVDRGPPVQRKPVDVTLYSGLLPRPPRNCPSPGDSPPRALRHTGGGPFTSGNLTVVDAVERVPATAPAARVRFLPTGLRVRVCGAPGIALLRFTQRVSPPGRNVPVWTRSRWQDELRQRKRCQTHRIDAPVASAGGRRRIEVRARTSGRRWSRTAVRVVDLP